jgi:glutamate 5-kinase
MATKIAAAKIATNAGCRTLIALGRCDAPLAALEAGARHTCFEVAASPAAAYKAWIGGALTPRGALAVDAGAAAALREGKSLLAAGVRDLEGRFGKGDAVIIRDEVGQELGRGLVRYDAAEARQIIGLRSAQIEAALGYAGGPLVHADDLALAVAPPEPA